MDKIEQRILEIIDSRKDDIIAIGRDIWNHAELGYREYRTSKIFADEMKKLGIETEEGLAVTGVKGYLKGKDYKKGPTVALMGELDGLPISDHVNANPETGAAHACGHNAQIAGVIGASYALSHSDIASAMDGNIVFFAVPAEEYADIEFREKLRKEEKIKYGGGKCELIRIGAMDDIDITVGHHSGPKRDLSAGSSTYNGFVNKMVTYYGKSAHAASGPGKGIDAFNAANLAVHAIDLQRESFREKDTVRIHGFIAENARANNVIAEKVVLEYCVRANNIPAIKDASEKADRAFRAGAVATGCGVIIQTLPGYMPKTIINDLSVAREAIKDANHENKYRFRDSDEMKARHSTGSNDYADLSYFMPVVNFGTGGFSGSIHNVDFHPVDEYLAYVMTAKIFALTGYKLLRNGGEYAKALSDSFEALMTKEEYIKYMNSMLTEEVIEPSPLPVMKK